MSEPTFRPDRLVAAGEANDASGQRNGSTLPLSKKIRRCVNEIVADDRWVDSAGGEAPYDVRQLATDTVDILEALEGSLEGWEQLRSCVGHVIGCDEPDDPGCPACIADSEIERIKEALQ